MKINIKKIEEKKIDVKRREERKRKEKYTEVCCTNFGTKCAWINYPKHKRDSYLGIHIVFGYAIDDVVVISDGSFCDNENDSCKRTDQIPSRLKQSSPCSGPLADVVCFLRNVHENFTFYQCPCDEKMSFAALIVPTTIGSIPSTSGESKKVGNKRVSSLKNRIVANKKE